MFSDISTVVFLVIISVGAFRLVLQDCSVSGVAIFFPAVQTICHFGKNY